ncbi:hypothetical protein BRC97_01265 [Halobacteriales archaeon QS_6_71_20]|nr:MAG: hypothetical protein BRC97_01265 [Halobacteriales archaeon QS_6_71_20]
MEAVSKGDEVLSLNKHTYEQEFREVQATIKHTDDRLVRITLEDGTEIVGTEDHSFLTADGLEITAVEGSEVEEGTWMPLSRTLPSAESVTEIDLAEYLGDANNVIVDGGVVHSGPRTESRTLELDFDAGKEVGLYLAEGSFDSQLTLQISNVDDGVREFLGSRGYNVYDRTCNKGFQPYARFLESEFGRGSAAKTIPGWVFDTPAGFRAGVVSGYVDGDGTVGETTAAAMSKSDELVDGLQELLRQFGVSSTVREKFTLYDGERRRYRRITVDAFCLERFAEVVDLSVDSKAERLTDLVSERDGTTRYDSKDMIPNFGPVLNAAARSAEWTKRDSDRRVDGASVHNLTRRQTASRATYNRLVDELDIHGRARAFGSSDIHWKRVASVEPLDEERSVYDLDVAFNDNFVANGVFVHNSNTASVVIEKLLANSFPVLIVDSDGEYYGLKEEFEILHVGADGECDIQVSAEHAGKIASLALEQNVPIILDVSGYLDEDEASELIRETARQLFAKEKKLKKPFLMLVEECHEYIPEGAGMDKTGKTLIKIGKRGRKHGLGIVGISQRPADVKKDFITQCDWLCWHRLTWDNDTKVVSKILGSEYGEAIEDMDDGEAFLMTDWAESIRRVQFHRKETFDAGATPGLDDFERPDLKSVSGDLVSELESITEERERTESELADLRQELDKKRQRITQLERELEEARDMSEMADTFAQALLRKSGASYRDGSAPEPRRREDDAPGPLGDAPDDQSERHDYEEPASAGTAESGSRSTEGTAATGSTEHATAADVTRAADEPGETGTDAEAEPASVAAATNGSAADDGAAEAGEAAGTPETNGATETNGAATAEPATGGRGAGDDRVRRAVPATDGVDISAARSRTGFPDADDAAAFLDGDELRRREAVVAGFVRAVESLEPVTRRMLSAYREAGRATPVEAHLAADGSGDRRYAYARNRTLRRAGFVDHRSEGEYAYALPRLVRRAYGDRTDEQELVEMVAEIEARAGLDTEPSP